MADFKIAKIRYTWKGNWAATTSYVKDDVIYYAGNSYVCLLTHTASSGFTTDLSANKWVLMFDGSVWRTEWTIDTSYYPGDIVTNGGIIYQCVTKHTSSPSVTLGLNADINKWTIIATSEAWKNAWQVSTLYKVGDQVKYGGTAYRCVTQHTSATEATDGLENDQSKWEVLFQQVEFLGTWTTGTRYKLNDVVKYGGGLWICITPHSAVTTFIDDRSNWNTYLVGMQMESAWDSLTPYQLGDVVTYGGYSYRALTESLSQTPSTATSFWAINTTNYNFRGDWSSSATYLVGDVVRFNGYTYISTTDSVDQTPPSAIYWQVISTGRKWLGNWSADTSYRLGDIVTYITSSFECINAHTSRPANRPDIDVVQSSLSWKYFVQGNTTNVLAAVGDLAVYSSGATTRLARGTDSQVLKVSSTELQWGSFNTVSKVYYVAPSGTDAANYGNTLDKPWRTIRYACLNVTGSATIFVKTGVYSEILPISIPANVSLVGDELRQTVVQPATGYETSNMFYARNGAIIRNMTLQGLAGTLGAANEYGTQRPTAGAYVSLDPGIGPDDSTVWISSKSPYIQNVTTFGTGCIGLKIDGTLHNNGNKSIVANDFTQVLSDGIGVWVTGTGSKSELVSVFTYYNHIGYLAENGGKIRATNGNNSYGKYGSVSEGVDPTEVPITAKIDNRSRQAIVGFTFTDGSSILALEYTNAGIGYSSANYSFTGNGAGAVTSSANIRNNALYNIRLVDPGTGNPAGGYGYFNVINYAQTGTSGGTITIASNDVYTSSNYIGMRVMLTVGKGVGQFGYIQAYDAETKVATIYKESDSTPGWDHIVTGTAIQDLDTTSQYSIEPRVVISAPGVGIRAIARVIVSQSAITNIRILDPGSNYVGVPTITITDPNASTAANIVGRIGNGVLAQPSWTSTGTGYITANTTVTGDGYADQYQIGSYIYVKNLTDIPGPGANFLVDTIGTVLKYVSADEITGAPGNYNARVRLTPAVSLLQSPPHDDDIVIRIKYSQNRLTGHDFLSIGYGNTTESNYPNLPLTTALQPNYQTVEGGGGRVFFTATDQDGNFNVGGLFAVQQATGIITLSADNFDLTGLSTLTIGGLTLGGTSATINSFSTDPYLTQNSDNVIPTQKAIKAYINARIGGGATNLTVSNITMGQITITGAGSRMSSVTNINMDTKVKFTGGVDGYMLASTFFLAKI